MRAFSIIFFWLGIAGIIAAIVVGFRPGWDVYIQYQQLEANRSAPFTNNLPQLALAGAVLWLAGFLVGLGIGMHRRKKTPSAPAPVAPQGGYVPPAAPPSGLTA